MNIIDAVVIARAYPNAVFAEREGNDVWTAPFLIEAFDRGEIGDIIPGDREVDHYESREAVEPLRAMYTNDGRRVVHENMAEIQRFKDITGLDPVIIETVHPRGALKELIQTVCCQISKLEDEAGIGLFESADPNTPLGQELARLEHYEKCLTIAREAIEKYDE